MLFFIGIGLGYILKQIIKGQADAINDVLDVVPKVIDKTVQVAEEEIFAQP